MNIEQLRIFGEKGMFYQKELESAENKLIFKKISSSVFEAFEELLGINIAHFDNTTRANMLNNLVVEYVNQNCESGRFEFIKNLSKTRRSIGILDEKYILLFKKFPISNLKTMQDDLLKHQELDKHVIYVVYEVDDFWSSISSIKWQYFSTPTNLIVEKDITNFAEIKIDKVLETEEKLPLVSIKKELIIKKKAE